MLTAFDPSHRFQSQKFLRDWVIATIIGLVIGSLLNWYIPRIALEWAKDLEHWMGIFIPRRGVGQVILTIPSYLLTTTHVAIVIATCLSLAQGIVLQKWRWRSAKMWLAVSLVGSLFSYALMADLNLLAILVDPDPRLLKGLGDSGVWVGAILGGAQWWVMREHSRQAGWWVVISLLVWGVGSTVHHYYGVFLANRLGFGVYSLLRLAWGANFMPAVSLFSVWQALLWIFGGMVCGIVTGRVFLRLVKNRLES